MAAYRSKPMACRRLHSRTISFLIASLLLLASPALAADRLDVYTKDGQRQGWAAVVEQTGRVDLYDKDGRRQGFGQVRDQRLELFDTKGRRESVVTPAPPLRQPR